VKKIRISVRQLVEFILRSGDIDNRRYVNTADAMLQGARIHRRIQGSQGTDYTSEVPLVIEIDCGYYVIEVSGRADGIINNNSYITVDEIKGTYADVEKLEEPVPVHFAQAKCYAYIVALNNTLERVGVRMTYCGLRDDNIRYFETEYTFEELSEWFTGVIDEYKKWAEFQIKWNEARDISIRQTEFPYEYRPGQKELAEYVYRTIYHKKRLFLQAPTGTGKTLSVIFPSVKAVAEDKAEKIFYLTAKNAGAIAAIDAYGLLRNAGLKFKTVHIIAKEKMCVLPKPECNPEACPYAKGHFDRINDAVYELLTTTDEITTERIKSHADKKRVCPFEMALDVSLFCDGIICDYNYVFDPRAALKRFFGEAAVGRYIFLVDEAHNLVDRGREMYSACLVKEDVKEAGKRLKDKSRVLDSRIKAIKRQLDGLEGASGDKYIVHTTGDISGLILSCERFAGTYEDVIKEQPLNDETIEQFYFNIRTFLDTADRLDEKYTVYSEYSEDGRFMLNLFNTDPSENLMKCFEKAVGTVLFSATLLPVRYYMDLLTGDRNDYAVYARSVFDPGKLGVYIAGDVSSKYNRRSGSEYRKIAEGINAVVSLHKGNYMVFFPSYNFMEEVYSFYHKIKTDDIICLMQGRNMTEEERVEFLENFDKHGSERDVTDDIITYDIEIEDDNITTVGFCVLGGVFSEGIDLTEESLIGSIIVGTGLPMVCTEREILRRYFDMADMDGFDYAYRIPGMNKVLQAAGRVIRTENDTGIVVLMDERFKNPEYTAMFPKEWSDIGMIDRAGTDAVKKFWSRF